MFQSPISGYAAQDPIETSFQVKVRVSVISVLCLRSQLTIPLIHGLWGFIVEQYGIESGRCTTPHSTLQQEIAYIDADILWMSWLCQCYDLFQDNASRLHNYNLS